MQVRTIALAATLLSLAHCSSREVPRGDGAADGPAGSGGVAGRGGSDAGAPAGSMGGGVAGGAAAGGSGTGGIAGGGGSPLCTHGAPANLVEACVFAISDGAPLTMSVSAKVTVQSISDVPGGNCQRLDNTTSGDTATRLILYSEAGEPWVLYLRIPNLPATLIRMGELLDLTVTASPRGFLGAGEAEQTIVLARAGQLLAFGHTDGSDLPTLDSFGIAVSDAGASCSVERCANVPRRTYVAAGGAAATIDQGQTARVGNLSFTVEERSNWFSNGGCDGSNRSRMGGYLVSQMTGGTGGGGMSGIGGTSGRGGGGGTSGLPACASGEASPTTIEACAFAEDGSPFIGSISSSVTVVSVDEVAGGNCRPIEYVGGGPTMRLVLRSAAGARWTVFLRVPNLPSTLIRANDTLDLKISGANQTLFMFTYISQSIVLSRAGALLAFGTIESSPDLASFGIDVTSTSVACQPTYCTGIPRRTHVTAGGTQAEVTAGQTKLIGDLSFTVEANSGFYGSGGCDARGSVSMAGFVVP